MATAGKPITCRAAVLWEAGEPYSVETVEVGAPKQGEVRIKIKSSGICHSDLFIQNGNVKGWNFPTLLGHESAGEIESVGEGVTSFQPGDLVLVTLMAYCRKCDLCKNPATYKCRKQPRNNLQMDGTPRISARGKFLSQMNTLGTFSEYTVTSQYNVMKINPKANPKSVCLASCCLPSGYGSAVNAAKVFPGATCAVWGLGGVGMCVLMGCKDSGASKIIGIDINPKKFELAKELGATECLNPNDVNSVPETLAKMTSEEGVDFCFVAVGIVSVLEEAFKSSNCHWGKTVVIGLCELEATMKVRVFDFIEGKQIIGTYLGNYKTVRDIPDLVEKCVSGEIQLEKLISHRIPLDKINDGFKMLKTGESIRTIIDFDLKD